MVCLTMCAGQIEVVHQSTSHRQFIGTEGGNDAVFWRHGMAPGKQINGEWCVEADPRRAVRS